MAMFLPRSRTHVEMDCGEVITPLRRRPFEYSTDVGRNFSHSSTCNHGKRQAYENLFNPISGFLAAGYTQIATLDQVSDKPHALMPQCSHSIRVHCVSAPPDTRRMTERDPGGPYLWNSRRLLDATIRANLKNYNDGTYQEGSNIEDPMFLANHPLSRDDLAKRYMYRSSTQSAYEQVPWDMKLHPRRWKPVSTMEGFSSQSLYRVRPPTHPPSNSFMKSTENWDRNQLRRSHSQQNTLHQGNPGYADHVEEMSSSRQGLPAFSSKPTGVRLSVM